MLKSKEGRQRYQRGIQTHKSKTKPWLKIKKTNRQTIVHKTQHLTTICRSLSLTLSQILTYKGDKKIQSQ